MTELPPDLDELEAQLEPSARYVVKVLRQALEDLKSQNAILSEQLAQMQRMLFGKRSEKLPPIESEVRRTLHKDELTVEGEPMPKEEPKRSHEIRRITRKKSEPERRVRRKLRKNLPVVHEKINVMNEDLPVGAVIDDFREICNGDVIRRVEHVREHLVVVEYQLQTLASKKDDTIIKAKAPLAVVPGGHYGPGVYAHVITAKCADSLPLYRIERMLERAGCPIARSTLCQIFHRGAELLEPIYKRILERAKNDPYLHADETTLKVQQRGTCLTGWIWAILSKDAIAYAFDKTRKGEVAERLIGGTEGYLVIDGYAGYNGVIGDSGRIRVGCWGHARRKFFEAMNAAPFAREALDLIVELYRIEHRAAERDILGAPEHHLLRQSESKPIVELIEAWIDEHHDNFPPKSKIGKALTYATNQRKELKRFLQDPKLPLDNNFAERGLRIVAIGRKNFLFAGHEQGAQNLAVLQSITSTCRLHGVNPYEYIKDILIKTQTHPVSKVDQLMPWNWKQPPNDEPKQPTTS